MCGQRLRIQHGATNSSDLKEAGRRGGDAGAMEFSMQLVGCTAFLKSEGKWGHEERMQCLALSLIDTERHMNLPCGCGLGRVKYMTRDRPLSHRRWLSAGGRGCGGYDGGGGGKGLQGSCPENGVDPLCVRPPCTRVLPLKTLLSPPG